MVRHYGRVEPAPRISFCIVNTNSKKLLLSCLQSIFRDPPKVPFEVLVLDNASSDGSAEAVRSSFGERVRLSALSRRRSKPENDSELMRRAEGDYCLLLNEDSELTAGAADALLEALEERPDAAAAGAQLLSPDGTSQPSAWRFPTVLTALAGTLMLHRRYTVQSNGATVREVDWAQSAGLMIRKAAFEQVGPLDPAFFVYSDEVDWQKRAHEGGWSVLFVPHARIVHHEQLSTGDSAKRRIVEFSRNRDLYMKKHHGMLAALAVRLLTAWSYTLRAIVALLLSGHNARRYLMHAYYSLFPARGQGIRAAAEEYNLALAQQAERAKHADQDK